MKNPYELAGNVLQVSSNEKNTAASSDAFTSIDLYGASVQAKAREDPACNRFQLENESGTGDITLYTVFSGIELVYNDMHMAYCNKQQEARPDVMEINYCKEGRSECLFGEHQYCYMASGDLSFCSLQENSHQSEFPTAHYHGITITIDFFGITEEMKRVLEKIRLGYIRVKVQELLLVLTGLDNFSDRSH